MALDLFTRVMGRITIVDNIKFCSDWTARKRSAQNGTTLAAIAVTLPVQRFGI